MLTAAQLRRDHRGQIVAPVEAVLELDKSTRRRVPSADGAKGAQECIFDITEHGVDPFESGMFSCLSSTTYDMSFMDAFCLNHGIETLKPIRDNRTSWINIFPP